jgi:hypothetical protein
MLLKERSKLDRRCSSWHGRSSGSLKVARFHSKKNTILSRRKNGFPTRLCENQKIRALFSAALNERAMRAEIKMERGGRLL